MKSILLVRHAKSSWENFSIKDFDRPLNDRGKKAAPEMAERLVAKKIPIDAFVSSPAKRASKTAEAFVKVFDISKDKIIYKDKLYEPSDASIASVIADLDNQWNTVAIFSHNPGITDFANELTSTRIDNMPTAGIFAVRANILEWKDFEEAEKEFWFFDFPKNEQD